MKRKAPSGKRGSSTKRRSRGCSIMVKGTLSNHLMVQLDQVSLKPSRFQKLLDSEAHSDSIPLDFDADAAEDKDFILSQDFFCTPDYITPEMPAIAGNVDWSKENVQCPKSPEKVKTARSKRQKLNADLKTPFGSIDIDHQPFEDLGKDTSRTDEMETGKLVELQNVRGGYVSQSAVALRCRVMPPPCLKNPYIKHASDFDTDPFSNQRSKCAGYSPAGIGGDGLSRYRTDFHEIEKIGSGNFNNVFKALKRIEGCMYAVKHSMKQLHQETERRKALMEVQALAALGYHENVVGYYSSWFENEHLYIQLELCDRSLSVDPKLLLTEVEALDVMYQVAKALQFIHSRGIAHLDVKPDNIYVKDGVYKLGDFGCATTIDKSLPVEEGDARYMPQEILNENYDNLDKVDIFSLGASIYELVRGSPLPESGPHFLHLREGKLHLLPGRSVQFRNLIKAMMDANPVRRPSARELVQNPIFGRLQKTIKSI